MTKNIKKFFATAINDINRNRSMSFTIIINITLSYLILTVFFGAAYASYKFIRFIETRKHMEIFFNPGTSEEVIFDFKSKIEADGNVDYVEYVSQKQAEELLISKYADSPLILQSIERDKLPPSLEIRSKNITLLPQINEYVKSLDPDTKHIYKIAYNEEFTGQVRDFLFWIQLIGLFILIFVVATIFYLSLLAVEISMKSRKDELEIMELVGGGKWFIRMPFIFQGFIYGFTGALSSSFFIGIFWIFLAFMHDQSPTLSFITNFFSEIHWPHLSIWIVLLLVVAKLFLGTVLGGFNSLIAVTRRMGV